MTKEKEYIDVKNLLLNEPYDIEIPGIGYVKIRDPTEADFLDVEVSASKHPLYDKQTDAERLTYFNRLLALRMLVEPNVSEEEFKQANFPKMEIVLDTVVMHYTTKIAKMNERRREMIKSFLEALKVKS